MNSELALEFLNEWQERQKKNEEKGNDEEGA